MEEHLKQNRSKSQKRAKKEKLEKSSKKEILDKITSNPELSPEIKTLAKNLLCEEEPALRLGPFFDEQNRFKNDNFFYNDNFELDSCEEGDIEQFQQNFFFGNLNKNGNNSENSSGRNNNINRATVPTIFGKILQKARQEKAKENNH